MMMIPALVAGWALFAEGIYEALGVAIEDDKGDKWLDRIYHIRIGDTGALFGDTPVWKSLESYYTLRATRRLIKSFR